MQCAPPQRNYLLWWKSAFLAIAAIALCFVCWRSVLLAAADAWYSTGDPAGAAEAAAIDPGRVDYPLFSAQLEEAAGGDPLPYLERAAALSPNDGPIREKLGLSQEIAGRYADAERSLLEAARLSRHYSPRWTLTNFYYRRGNQTEFWRWAREAVETSYGDRTLLFRLLWQADPDAGRLLDTAIPDERPLRMAWLWFLIGERHTDAMASLAGQLAPDAEAPERPAFLTAIDRLLATGDYARAGSIWDDLLTRGLVPTRDGEPGNVLTGGNFTHTPLGHAFDWRIQSQDGVFLNQTPGAWSLSFDGTEPERCELLGQPVLLEAGAGYRLRTTNSYRPPTGAESPDDLGLFWRLRAAGGRVLGEGPITDWSFTVPDGVSGARLILAYARPRGEVRLEGRFELNQASLVRISR